MAGSGAESANPDRSPGASDSGQREIDRLRVAGCEQTRRRIRGCVDEGALLPWRIDLEGDRSGRRAVVVAFGPVRQVHHESPESAERMGVAAPASAIRDVGAVGPARRDNPGGMQTGSV